MEEARMVEIIKEKGIKKGDLITVLVWSKDREGWVGHFWLIFSELSSGMIAGHRINIDDYEKNPKTALEEARQKREVWIEPREICEIRAYLFLGPDL